MMKTIKQLWKSVEYFIFIISDNGRFEANLFEGDLVVFATWVMES